MATYALHNRNTLEFLHSNGNGLHRSNPISTSPNHKNSGFSLIELLVVLVISSLLMALLMPNFIHLRESARQAACASNEHHIGLGLAFYADENFEYLPKSYFNGGANRDPQPQNMIAARLNGPNGGWDSMGMLFASGIIRSPEVFYCPSHIGLHPFEKYDDKWYADRSSKIAINYHYRHEIDDVVLPDRQYTYWLQFNSTSPVLSDGMQTKNDFNHVIGTNMLRLDASVKWFQDTERIIYRSLPDNSDNNGRWGGDNPWNHLPQR